VFLGFGRAELDNSFFLLAMRASDRTLGLGCDRSDGEEHGAQLAAQFVGWTVGSRRRTR